MKKYLRLIAISALVACQPNTGAADDENLVSQRVFTSRLGGQEVYGVQLQTTGSKRGFASYAIQLSLDNKVWLDTQRVQIIPNDTLESEIIFSEAVTVKGKEPQLRIERIEK